MPVRDSPFAEEAQDLPTAAPPAADVTVLDDDTPETTRPSRSAGQSGMTKPVTPAMKVELPSMAVRY